MKFCSVTLTFICIISFLIKHIAGVIPLEISTSWKRLDSIDGIRFSGRNAFAATVFKDKIWLVGGRSDNYAMYNMQFSFKNADVWFSTDGRSWTPVQLLFGDFYAQNKHVKQPGVIAPWYERFGHSLDAVDMDGDGEADVMVMMGGYSPTPSNDVWVTEDGITWVYCGLAPWSARAWHGTVVFGGKLFIMGGSPLNNEVWRLDSLARIHRNAPLTRASYVDYTFNLTWTRLNDAPWSPRVGIPLVSQWYFNESAGETMADSAERVILTGGFGGFLEHDPRYYGFRTFNDVWESRDGCVSWRLLTEHAPFSPRGWHAIQVLPSYGNITRDSSDQRPGRPPRMYLIGGGDIGFSLSSQRKVETMQGMLDAWYSEDGIEWTTISYEEGGGSTTVTQFGTQEWTVGFINNNAVYVGRWGHVLLLYSPPALETSERHNYLYLIGGQQTDGGSMSNEVYQSSGGLFCNLNGIRCSGHGACGANNTGCECLTTNPLKLGSGIQIPLFVGEYCADEYVRGG